MSSAALNTVAGLVATVCLAGCGLSDPYNAKQPLRHPQPSGGAVGHVAPQKPRTVAGGVAALRRFASLYANRSASSASAGQRALISLSTGTFARALRRSWRAAVVEAVRGLPAGARLLGTASIEPLSADGAGAEHGTVLIAEQLQLADGATEAPVIELYHVSLRRTRSGWRVAAFTYAG
jgi:hypothetical protein